MGHREAIVDAATALFDDQGYSRTTTSEIALQAGVTKRTLYRHLASKDAVLAAIHEQMWARLLAWPAEGDDVEDGLRRFIKHYVDTLNAHRSELRVFYRESKYLSSDSLLRVTASSEMYRQSLEAILERGVETRALMPLDIPLVAGNILGMLSGLHEWYKPDGSVHPEQLSDFISTTFLAGLAAGVGRLPTIKVARSGRASHHKESSTTRQIVAATEEAQAWSRSPILKRILDAAAELFQDRGYDGATTKELARASQLPSPAALYYYVPNKEEILFQLRIRSTVSGIEYIEGILQAGYGPVEALSQLMIKHTQTVATHREALRALTYEMRFLDAGHLEKITAIRDEYTRMFCEVVERALGSAPGASRGQDVPGIAVLGMLNWMKPAGSLAGVSEPTTVGAASFDTIWTGLARTRAQTA
jgi:AcrR family transcriptional regulator